MLVNDKVMLVRAIDTASPNESAEEERVENNLRYDQLNRFGSCEIDKSELKDSPDINDSQQSSYTREHNDSR